MATVLTRARHDWVENAMARAIESAWGNRFGSVRITHERVAPTALLSVIDTVGRDTFRAAQELLERYKACDVDPFLPAHLGTNASDGVLFAPIVERHPLGLIILDGVHRTLAAHKNGFGSVWVALVSTRRSPDPPRSPQPLPQVVVSTSKQGPPPLFKNRRNENFRPSKIFTDLTQKYFEILAQKESR